MENASAGGRWGAGQSPTARNEAPAASKEAPTARINAPALDGDSAGIDQCGPQRIHKSATGAFGVVDAVAAADRSGPALLVAEKTKISPATKLRVLLIGHQFQVPSEGQAKARALSQFEDLDVTVLCPDRYKEAEVRWRHPKYSNKNVRTPDFKFFTTPVYNAWCGPAKWYLHWYPRLGEKLSLLKPDIIDLWEEPWSLLSAQIAFLCRRAFPRCRFISETEQNIEKKLPPPFEFFRSFSLRRADYVVARNQEASSVVRRKGFGGRVEVVGNGVDTGMFRPMERSDCRALHAVGGFVVGYAGRLVEEKGLRTLVNALRQMDGPRTLLLSGDGPLKKELLAESFVKWCGALPRESLPRFYNALDALVLPSRTTPSWKEQFGRVIVEAQACGVPVVGSDSGAIPEVIGTAGMVFPEGDSSGLRSVLERLRGDPCLREQLSQDGRAQACRRYSWQAIASQMREIYLGCALSPSGGI